MRTLRSITAALPLVLSAALAAQSGPLIGFTGNPGSSSLTSQVLCNPSTTVCPNALPAPSEAWAGGAAYDPVREGIWHTQGTRLVFSDAGNCMMPCTTAANRALGASSRATGLTIVNHTNELWQLESVPGLAALTVYDLSTVSAASPCPRPRTTCRFTLPTATRYAGAIAYDGENDRFFVATSEFTPGAGPASRIVLVRRNDPFCQPTCLLPTQSCGAAGPLGSIRAMAFEECSDTLYVSDGRQTATFRVVETPGSPCPILVAISCCPLNHPAGEFWAGFDLDGGVVRVLGSSCTSRPCPNCPTMGLSAVGSPQIGNQDFGFRIDDAPLGLGFVFLNSGPCVTTQPFACGQILPQLPVVALPAFPIVGPGGPCSGSGQVGLPIPNDYSLCNELLCVQGAVFCQGGGIGLTNGLVVVLGS